MTRPRRAGYHAHGALSGFLEEACRIKQQVLAVVPRRWHGRPVRRQRSRLDAVPRADQHFVGGEHLLGLADDLDVSGVQHEKVVAYPLKVGDETSLPNCLPLMDGWNHAARLYQPRPEVRWNMDLPKLHRHPMTASCGSPARSLACTHTSAGTDRVTVCLRLRRSKGFAMMWTSTLDRVSGYRSSAKEHTQEAR